MSNIRLEVFPGEYSNENVYSNVLNYIFQKNSIGGYGIYPYELEPIVEQFQQSEKNSKYKNPQKIWHFAITFDKRWDTQTLYSLANEIAEIFLLNYQILFGVDLGHNSSQYPHLHFAVNAFSYHPEFPILSSKNMRTCMNQILKLLHERYPFYSTTFKFPK